MKHQNADVRSVTDSITYLGKRKTILNESKSEMKLCKELARKKALLIETLVMASIAVDSKNDDEIADCLEELEGDHYTFFDRTNLIDLANANVLNDWQVEKIVDLKSKITNINSALWNKTALAANAKWAEVRHLSREIIRSLKNAISPNA